MSIIMSHAILVMQYEIHCENGTSEMKSTKVQTLGELRMRGTAKSG